MQIQISSSKGTKVSFYYAKYYSPSQQPNIGN